jgi:hypothetical protein
MEERAAMNILKMLGPLTVASFVVAILAFRVESASVEETQPTVVRMPGTIIGTRTQT